MRKLLSVVLFGALVWLVPFVLGMFLFTMEGEPRLELMLTKSILLLVFAGTAAGVLVWWFRRHPEASLSEGALVGVGLFVVVCGLDLLVLLPLTGQTVSSWAGEIGLRYLLVPMMAGAMGAVLAERPVDRDGIPA